MAVIVNLIKQIGLFFQRSCARVSVEHITLPNGITSIENNAFKGYLILH